MAKHSETCSITPIYAGVAEKYPDVNPRMWLDLTMVSKQSAIKCAQCGKQRAGRDLLVVYEAPLYNSAGGSHLYDYKYPHNVVKAICPEHNTIGRAKFRRARNSGY